MSTDLSLYQSYLLRLWRESINGDWRASLQNISTGQCRYFASLSQLSSFLEEVTSSPIRVWTEVKPPAHE